MGKEEGKRRLAKPLELLGRYKYALAVVLLGVLLLAWPAGRKEPGSDAPSAAGIAPDTVSLPETEAAMEEILGRIQGVGRVDVMLTLQGGNELVLAEDTTLRYSGSTQAPDDYERSSTAVMDDGGVVVRQEKYPRYRGALVVCDGAGSDAVRLRVTGAVAALTGLGSDRIAVVPRDSGSENSTS